MPKKSRGRPLKEIDGDMLRQMAMIGCTTETIAQHFHCSRDTIERRFRWEIDEGKSAGQIRIRGKLFQAAMNGSHWTYNTLVYAERLRASLDARTRFNFPPESS